MAGGRSVRLFLTEGAPTGVLTAEIVNWTGHVLAGPRSKLKDAVQRSELQRTGIYILYGFALNEELPTVYVGEGDDISRRLTQHSKDDRKDFWERFIAVTNKDLNLTKAHVRYLEGKLIAQLVAAKKAKVANGTEPAAERLPEADISDMDAFIEEIMLILPVIGVDFFRQDRARADPRPSPPAGGADDQVVFLVEHGSKGIRAKAVETDGEFVLLAGSRGDLNESVSFHERLRSLRKQLLESGRARKVEGNSFELTEDLALGSPSAGAVFLFGTTRNGRTDWRVEGDDLTYADWKDRQLEQSLNSGSELLDKT